MRKWNKRKYYNTSSGYVNVNYYIYQNTKEKALISKIIIEEQHGSVTDNTYKYLIKCIISRNIAREEEKRMNQTFESMGFRDAQSFASNDPQRLSEYLQCIDELEPLEEISDELFRKEFDDRNEFDNPESFYQQLLIDIQKNDDDLITRTIEKATKYLFMYPDSLWNIAEKLFDMEDFSKAADVYQLIPDNNAHFQGANKKILEIINNLFNAYDRKDIELTDDEILRYKEAQLRCAIISGEDNQFYVNRLFQELSGIGIIQLEQDVKGEPEFIISITTLLNKYVEENKRLRVEVERLQKKSEEILDSKSPGCVKTQFFSS